MDCNCSESLTSSIAIGVCTAELNATSVLGSTEHGFAWLPTQLLRQTTGITHKYPHHSIDISSHLLCKQVIIGVKLDFRNGITSLSFYCNGTPLGIAFCSTYPSKALSLNTIMPTSASQADVSGVSTVVYYPAVSLLREKVTLRTTELVFVKEYIKYLDQHDQ